MRSNTLNGPPFFTTDYTVRIDFADLSTSPPTPQLSETPAAPSPGYIPFPGANDGQQVLVTPASALPQGMTISYAVVVPPVLTPVPVPGYIRIGFFNFTGGDLPAAPIVLHIEVVPTALE